MKRVFAHAFALASPLFAATAAFADEGGVSFWLPGTYGSLAAVPGTPGLNFTTFNYNDFASVDKNAYVVRMGAIQAGLASRTNEQFISPSYVFGTPVLGGTAALGVTTAVGKNLTSVGATLAEANGRMLSGNESDSVIGMGDMSPTATLSWAQGANNFMTYLTGNIPVGIYNSWQLAAIGLGHAAMDAGGGYTFYDPATGHEFSAVVGATYNFFNPATQYKNGIDGLLDWGASQFLTKNFQIGAVGYLYRQLSGDTGSGAKLGAFESRVAGIGPQVGVNFPVAGLQGYANLKGYTEFDARDRPSGWNVWFTITLSPTGLPTAPSAKN